MKLNKKAFERAKSLIVAGKVAKDSDWIEVQLSSANQEKQLKETDWEEYTKWFLGIDLEMDEHDPLHYLYKYGDFEVVHRSGLLNVQNKAMSSSDHEILDAVNYLIVQIDKKPDVVTEASKESFPASDPPSYDRR